MDKTRNRFCIIPLRCQTDGPEMVSDAPRQDCQRNQGNGFPKYPWHPPTKQHACAIAQCLVRKAVGHTPGKAGKTNPQQNCKDSHCAHGCIIVPDHQKPQGPHNICRDLAKSGHDRIGQALPVLGHGTQEFTR